MASALISNKRTACIITHNISGLQFTVYLTDYNIEKYQEDEKFARELSEKYYKLQMQGLVTPVEDVELPPASLTNNVSSEDESQEPRTVITSDIEEQLISCVSQRPPLYDFRLPLQERSRSIIRELWEEIIAELRVNVSVEEISKKWKNLRDSYIRARANINKKSTSGSPAEDKRIIERLKAKHRNYDAMKFLDDSLTSRSTCTNLSETPAAVNDETPFTNARPGSNNSNHSNHSACTNNVTPTDQAFLDALGKISNSTSSDVYHFCMRLASGLEKLPRNIKNKLELEFLQKVAEAEEMYCNEN